MSDPREKRKSAQICQAMVLASAIFFSSFTQALASESISFVSSRAQAWRSPSWLQFERPPGNSGVESASAILRRWCLTYVYAKALSTSSIQCTKKPDVKPALAGFLNSPHKHFRSH
jgi:hypothetical protein